MGFLAEIAPDQKRFPQITQKLTGCRRETILPLPGQVKPNPAQREDPEVQHQQVKRNQNRCQDQATPVALGDLACTPAFALQRKDIEGEKQNCQGEIIKEVPQINHPPLNALEAAAGPKRPENFGDSVSNKS